MYATPASAADKSIGVMSTSKACGGTYYSVLSGTASKDGPAKVDFEKLSFGARASVPSTCAGAVTKLCLEAVMTATAKSGGISSSAPFGASLNEFSSQSALVRAGTYASQSASTCVSGGRRVLTVSVKPEDGLAFVTTGGVYKLARYSIAVRATAWVAGVKYVGAWATSAQTP